jgi:hypothetical protein
MEGRMSGMRKRIMPVLAVFAVVAVLLSAPECAFAQSRDGLPAVSGAARGAAAGAGPRAQASITSATVVDVAVILAATGAVIAMAPEVMGISAGVAAVGLIGIAATPKGQEAIAGPR